MIKELLGAKLSKKEFQTHVNDMHAYDIANELLELSDAERAIFFDALTTDQLADIFAYLEPDLAADFLSSFTSEKQTKILDELIVDDAVDILQSYDDPSLRDEVITTLEEAHIIKDIIKYDDDTVGAYISNDYVSINPRMDVKEASTSLIKQAPEAETINLLFVVDENNQYLGAVNLKTLVKARSPKLISEIMETIPAVSANSPITEAIYDMKNYELYELPVINKDNELIGILTLDDIIDVATHEVEEDYEKLAALPATHKAEKWLKTALRRLPWLIILMVISIPLMSFSDFMIGSISGVTILAFFQPLMLDSPGNVATQTLAVALKAISNEGRMKRSELRKEFVSNLLTSLLLGLITFIISFVFVYFTQIGLPASASQFSGFQTALIFAAIIAGSLTIVVSLVSLLAIAIPHIFKSLKVDPAVASGPFITTIIDFFSTLVYFGLAALILKGVGMI
ncbi:MAG: Magnesium transporter MgtE [Tenericutes bacterium ADurb.Bin239]|nr:MAG: Magnesium transporter MgtE [Tenericutes bacterium ADurb.Bin239]